MLLIKGRQFVHISTSGRRRIDYATNLLLITLKKLVTVGTLLNVHTGNQTVDINCYELQKYLNNTS